MIDQIPKASIETSCKRRQEARDSGSVRYQRRPVRQDVSDDRKREIQGRSDTKGVQRDKM